MRLAYADPPYPGKAHLYPENTEVDHAELIERLCEYDGWALSTDERSLRYVLGLCPDGVRIAAWCRGNAMPQTPYPIAAWEPVILRPARSREVPPVYSFLTDKAMNGTHQVAGLIGQKSRGFCEWVIRCMGALDGDTLDDLYPGTGIMGATFADFLSQPPLFVPKVGKADWPTRMNMARRSQDPLPGLPEPQAFKRRGFPTLKA